MAIRSGTPMNCGNYMANSTMVAVLGQIVCYTGRHLGWKRAIDAHFSFEPSECDFTTQPPVKPGPDGMYPVAVPGKTQLIPGI